MMEKRIQFYKIEACLLLVCFIFFGWMQTQPVQAADTDDSNFSLTAVKGTDQTENVDYFKFSPVLGKEYPLTLQITNNNDSSLELGVAVSTATTSASGLIYKEEPGHLIKKKYQLAQYVKLNQNTVTIPAKTTQEISFTLKIPENSQLSGDLIGGITVYKTSKASGNKNTVQIQSQVEKVKVIYLQLSSQPEKTELTYTNFQVGSHTGASGLEFQLTNTQPLLRNSDEATYKIIDSEETTVASGKIKTFQMAPMSNVWLQPSLEKSATLKSGTYQFILTKTDGRVIKKTFKINSAEIKKLKENKSIVKVNVIPKWLIGLLVVLIILVLASISLLIMNHFKHKKTSKKL